MCVIKYVKNEQITVRKQLVYTISIFICSNYNIFFLLYCTIYFRGSKALF